MIYKLPLRISGNFFMDEPQQDFDVLEAIMAQYFPGPISLSGSGLAEHEQEIQNFLQEKMQEEKEPLRDFYLGFLGNKVNEVALSVHTTKACLQAQMVISMKGELYSNEKEFLREQIHELFQDGFGSRFIKEYIPVSGGYLQIHLDEPEPYELSEQKKYEITEQRHPNYPWLHRIRALTFVNEYVTPGCIGGYVEREENLSQDDSAWVHHDAVCCEEARVEKDAQIFDGACVRGAALLTGDATMFGSATADGNCVIRSGEIKDHARVAGNAVVGESIIDGLSPLIQGNSRVYGTVRGLVSIKDVIFPGEEIVNPTQDMFLLENGKREVLVKKKELKPPEGYQTRQTKKKIGPER